MSISRETPNPDYNEIRSQDEKRIAAQFLIYYHSSLDRKKHHPTITELAESSDLSSKEIEMLAERLIEKGRAYFNERGGLVLKGYENWKYDLRGKLKANNSGKTKS